MSNAGMRRIRRLVGDVTADQLRYVDWALARDVGVFMPVAGPCGYAVTRNHVHPAWSFIVPFDDRGRVRIDRRVVHSQPGLLCAIGPGVPHEELIADQPARYAAVFVAPRLIQRALLHYGTTRLPPLRGESFPATSEIIRAVRELMLEHKAGLPGGVAILDATAVRLVHLILRALLRVERRSDCVPDRESIRRAVDLADAHSGDALTVRDLARAACMSPFHFSREFKRETGETPRAYLRRARLERAKKLLAADDRPMTEVALECGFCSSSHFATAFARTFRMPPSRYRAMMRHGAVRAQR